MGMIAKGNAGSRFYVDMENGDVFEESADGILFLMNSHELYDAAFPLTDPFLRNGESEYD